MPALRIDQFGLYVNYYFLSNLIGMRAVCMAAGGPVAARVLQRGPILLWMGLFSSFCVVLAAQAHSRVTARHIPIRSALSMTFFTRRMVAASIISPL
jgi:hypothetical protein